MISVMTNTKASAKFGQILQRRVPRCGSKQTFNKFEGHKKQQR